MASPKFNPGSLFGVPLSPFPPGTGWNSVGGMLRDMMADFRALWVQDFLLRPDPELCSFALSTENLALAISTTISMKRTSLNSLFIPAMCRGDLLVGIAVHVNDGSSAGIDTAGKGVRVERFVKNTHTGSMLSLSVDEAAGVARVSFQTLWAITGARTAHVSFGAARFLRAFRGGSVDFALLEQAILSSAAGYSGDSFAPPSSTIAKQPGARDNLWACGEFGVAQCTLVVSFYQNAVPVRAIPGFFEVTRELGAPASAVDRMLKWGVADALRRRTPVVPAPITPPVDVMSLAAILSPAPATSRTDTAPAARDRHAAKDNAQRTAAAAKRPVRIAPHPHAAQSVQLHILSKDEERKARKRLAAFKSNVKRSEQRRIARLAREQEKLRVAQCK